MQRLSSVIIINCIVAICSVCHKESLAVFPEMKNGIAFSQRCQECYLRGYQVFQCRHCLAEMQRRNYDKHLKDYHTQ